MTWIVESVAPDGSMDIKQTVDRVTFKKDSPFAPFNYDSRTDGKWAEEYLGPYWSELAGRQFRFRLSREGRVAWSQGDPESATESFLFGLAWGDEQPFPPLSSNPLVVGDQWTATMTSEDPYGLGGSVTRDFRLTYLGTDPEAPDDAQRVDFEITGTYSNLESAEVLKHRGNGRMQFDDAAARLLSLKKEESVTVRHKNTVLPVKTETSSSLEIRFESR
jgi:hypothetical protein